MHNLTAAELNSLCNFLALQTPNFYPSAQYFLHDLLSTGCRSHEPLLMNLWEELPAHPLDYSLHPLKKNKDRFIRQNRLSGNWQNAFLNNIKPYNSLSLRQLEYAMQLINPCGKMTVGGRGVISYIFRYNYVNELVKNGSTWIDIQHQMGWFNPVMPYSYASRVVVSQFNPFPL